MVINNLINAVYNAICAVKTKANGLNSIEFLQAYEQEEQTCNGKNARFTPAYTASLLEYVPNEVEAVTKAVEQLPMAYFNKCFEQCIPLAGFSACAFSMLVALHVIEYVLMQEFTTFEQYAQFMQRQFVPVRFNEA